MSSRQDDLLEDAMRLFFQTMKRPHNWARIAALARVDLDRPSAAILQVLMSLPAEQRRVHDLANLLGIEAPSVTRKTQELEQAGLLRRLPDSRDRRAIRLSVTPSGKAVSQRLRKAQRELISQAMRDWDDRSRRKFAELFQKFSQDFAEIFTN